MQIVTSSITITNTKRILNFQLIKKIKKSFILRAIGLEVHNRFDSRSLYVFVISLQHLRGTEIETVRTVKRYSNKKKLICK